MLSKVYHQLALCWGTVPMMIDEYKFTDTLLSASRTCAINTGLFEKGDTIIQTAGLPLGHVPTNLLKVDTL